DRARRPTLSEHPVDQPAHVPHTQLVRALVPELREDPAAESLPVHFDSARRTTKPRIRMLSAGLQMAEPVRRDIRQRDRRRRGTGRLTTLEIDLQRTLLRDRVRLRGRLETESPELAAAETLSHLPHRLTIRERSLVEARNATCPAEDGFTGADAVRFQSH